MLCISDEDDRKRINSHISRTCIHIYIALLNVFVHDHSDR